MPGESPTYYLPVPCLDIYSASDLITSQFRSQIQYMHCANMENGEGIQLQSHNEFYAQEGGTDFLFAVNTCAALQAITGKDNCYTQAESEALLYDFTVNTKVSSQFFSPKTYIDNGERMNSEFSLETFQLSTAQVSLARYEVQQEHNSFSNRVIYNDQFFTSMLLGTQDVITYSPQIDAIKTYPTSDLKKFIASVPYSEILYAPLAIEFTQAQSEINSSFIRFTLYEVLQKFGSYLAFILRFTGLLIGSFQKHSIDNSMIKKLYSAEPTKDEEDEMAYDMDMFDNSKT